MIALDKSFSGVADTALKGEDFRKLFKKGSCSKKGNILTKEAYINKKNPSFEEKLKIKTASPENNKLNCNKSITESSMKESDEALEKALKGNDDFLAIINAIYELLMGKKNFDLPENIESNISVEETPKIDEKYNNTLYSVLNGLLKLEDAGDEDLQKLKVLLEKTNFNWESKGEKEGLLQKFIDDNEFSLDRLNKSADSQKNMQMGKDKLEVKDLIKLLIEKLQNQTNVQDVPDKKTSEEIINYKPLDIIGKHKHKDVDVNLVKEKSTSKEENFLKSLIGENEEEKALNRVDEKVNKISNMDSLNNLPRVDRNSSVEVKENLTVNKANMLEDVVKSVKYMEANNLKNLTVKVMPKELGEIVIRLTMEQGKIKLALNATVKETYSLLNSNLGEISEKLNTANIKIPQTEINIYNDDATFFSGQFMGDNSKEREEGRNYSSKLSTGNVLSSDDEETMGINEDYNGNLNAKV